MNEWWMPEDRHDIEHAGTFTDLGAIALRIVARMPQPLGQVCGPISTGGAGSIEANLRRFRETIESLTRAGENIFDQMPFEEPMFEIRKRTGGATLLEDFYGPLFRSGLIRKLFFVPQWHTSVGANWEREQAMRLRIEIVDLDECAGRIVLP